MVWISDQPEIIIILRVEKTKATTEGRKTDVKDK